MHTKAVSFSLPPGKVTALVGQSGSGKSTIASLLLRDYDPQMGNIFIDNTDLRLLNLTSLHQQMAIVPQEPAMFSTTIAVGLEFELKLVKDKASVGDLGVGV